MLFGVELFFWAAFPSVGFLAANPLPGIKAAMKIIIRLEVMISINDEAGCEAVSAQNFGKGNIIPAEGLPLRFGKDALSRVINPSAGDGGQSFCISVCEQDTLFCKFIEIRCLYTSTSVTTEMVRPPGIGNDYNHIEPVAFCGLGS